MLMLPEWSVSTLDTVHCLSAERLVTALPNDYIDLIVASPPYDNLRTYNGFHWNFEFIAQQSYRVLKPGGVLVWIVGDATINGSETLTSFKQALYFKEVCGFNVWDTMIYQKGGCRPQRPQLRYNQSIEYMFILTKGSPKTSNFLVEKTKKQTKSLSTKRQRNGTMCIKIYHPQETHVLSNVWKLDTGNNLVASDRLAYEHPAIFPETLAERHIQTWSNPDNIVLDYFMGSGTTGKMATKLGRHYIGCDISHEYVELARRRIANADPFQPVEHEAGITQLSLFAEAE